MLWVKVRRMGNWGYNSKNSQTDVRRRLYPMTTIIVLVDPKHPKESKLDVCNGYARFGELELYVQEALLKQEKENCVAGD